jgi:hypothetical protein
MELPLAGGCLCGAIRYQISVEPRSADYCHCSMCRRAGRGAGGGKAHCG